MLLVQEALQAYLKRAMMSVAPPGANGTTIVTGRAGYPGGASAPVAAELAASSVAREADNSLRTIMEIGLIIRISFAQ